MLSRTGPRVCLCLFQAADICNGKPDADACANKYKGWPFAMQHTTQHDLEYDRPLLRCHIHWPLSRHCSHALPMLAPAPSACKPRHARHGTALRLLTRPSSAPRCSLHAPTGLCDDEAFGELVRLSCPIACNTCEEKAGAPVGVQRREAMQGPAVSTDEGSILLTSASGKDVCFQEDGEDKVGATAARCIPPPCGAV